MLPEKRATLGSEEVLALVADKWTVQILHGVLGDHRRFGALRRLIPTITRRMLTLRLRELERNGLLSRIDFGEMPSRIEYHLTPLGQSLVPTLRDLCQWSILHLEQVEEARRVYDAYDEAVENSAKHES